MSKKNKDDNFLDRIPARKESLVWKKDDSGIVTLEFENTGFYNRLAQKFFKRPAVSYVHLDEMGSFIWQHIDGEKTIIELGTIVKEKYDEKAEPLYERLSKYIQILESYGYVSLV